MSKTRQRITAWSGIVTMGSAAWGDESGSVVTFKLPTSDTADIRNPFHSFTKRRKGKAGTRFFMAVETVSKFGQTIYKDEVMLSGWNDSQQNGHTVKFWICNDAMGHPFEGISRKQELALVLTELNSDNSPVDQKMVERVEVQKNTSKQKMSNVAAMLCRTKDFWDWINDKDKVSKIVDEESAKKWMYFALCIKSRSEIDKDEMKNNLFRINVLRAYRDWYEKNRGGPNRGNPF